ncbi:MAG: hypothetical protein QOC70_2385 [Verrucomicrobiota bacterium]|jgi:hypothetical protein
MKKFTNLLIVASLALAGAVMAQQPMPEESPSKKAPDKKPPAEMKPRAPHAPKAEAPAVKEPVVKEPAAKEPAVKEPAVKEPAVKEPATKELPAAPKPDKKAPSSRKPAPAATAPEMKTEKPAATAPSADKKQQSAESKKDKKAPAPNSNTAMTPAATQAASIPATAKPIVTPAAPAASTAPAVTAPASAAPSISQTSPTKPVNPAAAAKKPDVQKVEQIKQEHANFHAQPRPDRVPAVTFSANFRIQGSDRWQGPQYEVYRSYHPERHDRGWYHSRYQRVELISGGYYYWNSGYWYPAWGYSPTEEYYAYDAPIYVGQHAEPPDKVIANVQAVLQEMGYYKGEVDGLLGPLTREALTGYQADQGLVATAVIDEPTLNSLGMG